MKYSVQFKSFHTGEWFEDRSYKSLSDAKATLDFHINVSQKACYGGRVVDVDTKKVVHGQDD